LSGQHQPHIRDPPIAPKRRRGSSKAHVLEKEAERMSTATLPGARHRFSRRFLTRLASGRPMGVGAVMYVAHRLTGLLLTVYLYIHLVTLGSVLQGPDGFDRAMVLMSQPVIRLLELALVGVVVFHAFNGLRLCLLALVPLANQKWLAYAVVAVSVLVMLLSLPLFLS
jgi:succinate dehydrogenase / fumarate reductase cytochrome b subunit